jgi:hypothetical protein
MSIGQIIVLTAIVGAFVVFAVVLAWGDYRAQPLMRRIRERNSRDAALSAVATAGKQKDERAAQARWPKPFDDRVKHVA